MSSYCDLETIVTSAAALLFTPDRVDAVKISGVVDLQIVGNRKDDDTRSLIFLEFIKEMNLSAPLQIDVQGTNPLRFYIQYGRQQDLYVDIAQTIKSVINKLILETTSQIKDQQHSLKGLESVLARLR
jgi:hypothetical protein